MLFGRSKLGGFMDEIRCDEPSYLIWKWHPSALQQGKNNRENAIRWGSSLRVKDGEVAVFVYNEKNGIQQDFIEGPYNQIIKTANFPVLASIVGLAYEGGTPFQAEIYFINLAKIIQVRFGVPFFDVYDPRFLDFGIPVSVRGTISFKIENYREFIKLHRLNTFSLDDFQKQIRDAISRYMKDIVTNTPAEHNIPVIQLESKVSFVNDKAEYVIKQRMEEDFGILVSGVDISSIEIDKASGAYQQLMDITKNVNIDRVQAETTDYIERLRIQREEGQYAQHKQTQSMNMGAFQIEKQSEVGIAGASALGEMGKSGTGTINLGNDGAGFNPASMMAGIAVGSAVGQNIAGTITGMMPGVNSVSSIQPNVSIPPVPPSTYYYVAVNEKPNGPYDLSTLSRMISAGQVTGANLIWKEGTDSWNRADKFDELKGLFLNKIPPIPPTNV